MTVTRDGTPTRQEAQSSRRQSGQERTDARNTAETTTDGVVWHLLVEEECEDLPAGTRITGQFVPTEFRHDLGSIIAEGGGFSRQHPIIAWVGGAVEVISFQARLFSEHHNSNHARDKFEMLKLLRIPQSPLGRPPLTRFFWGTAIPGGMVCFVESLGGVEYDEIRSDGSVRGLSLQITLKKFQPFTVERVSQSPVERTPKYIVRAGDTYEMIALHRYGDPLLGIPLRDQNPRYPMEPWAPKLLADLQPGEVIKLYPRKDLDTEPIVPKSHIFDNSDADALDNRRYFFAVRSAKTTILSSR